MILNNYFYAKRKLSYTLYSSTSAQYEDVTGIDGQSHSVPTQGNASQSGSLHQTINGNRALRHKLGVRVGTGNTDPTKNDYCLATDVTSSFSNASTTINIQQVTGDKLLTRLTFNGTNSSGSDITIKEVGIIKNYYVNSSSTTDVLFTREVLAEPMVVTNGGGIVITVDWYEE